MPGIGSSIDTTSTRFAVRSDDMGFAIYNGVFRVKVMFFVVVSARGDECLIGLLKLHGGYRAPRLVNPSAISRRVQSRGEM
jgi:hypothetical protein